MAATSQLREQFGDRTREILTDIFDFYIEEGEWILERELHKRYGGKQQVRKALIEVGGEAVYLSEETDTRLQRYELTLIGMFLTTHGPRCEELLAKYLSFAKEGALKDPELAEISSSDVEEQMGLQRDDLALLRILLERAYMFRLGGSRSDDAWKYDIPKNIEDIPDEVKRHVQEVVGEGFDPSIPIDPDERRRKLAGRSGPWGDTDRGEQLAEKATGSDDQPAIILEKEVAGTPDSIRAIMEMIQNRGGGVWKSRGGEQLEIRERRKIVTQHDTDGSLAGGLGGRIVGTRREDKTPSSRASWAITSPKAPSVEELESKRKELTQQDDDLTEERVERILDRLKRVAGIEVYQVLPHRARVEFLDGYEPYSDRDHALRLMIGSAFVEFAEEVVADLPTTPSGPTQQGTWIHSDIEEELKDTPYLLQEDIVAARRMTDLYAILHCYENSVRRFIEKTLAGSLGPDWWESVASKAMKQTVRQRKEKEEKERWLSPRGDKSPLYYLEWGDLVKIIRKREQAFLPHIGEIRFIESRFEDLESLRNIVAHHGTLPSEDDFNRAVLSFRDWKRQIGRGDENE